MASGREHAQNKKQNQTNLDANSYLEKKIEMNNTVLPPSLLIHRRKRNAKERASVPYNDSCYQQTLEIQLSVIIAF